MNTIESRTVQEHPATWLSLAAIAVLVVLAYGGTVFNGFVWDDETFIVHNAYVHDLARWPDYFGRAESITAAPDPGLLRMYRPLQTVSFALDAVLWGQWAGGYHLTSLLLHIAACYALLFAFAPLVGRRNAVLAALLFAVHPALSEGVLSLAARGNQLYTLFALLSIGAFIRISRPFDLHHIGAVLAALLSFFSKEQAIALIALLPLLQAVFERPGNLRAPSSVPLHLPFLLAAALFLGARLLVVDTSFAVPYWGSSLGQTLLMQAKVFVTYLRLLVWPFVLVGRYPVPYSNPLVVLHVALNAACIGLAAVLARRGGRGRQLSLAIAWFYLSLAPVSNIIPIPGNMTGERFIYFTFAGMVPLIVASLPGPLPARSVKPAAVAALCVVLAFVVTDLKRTAVWRDNLRFFSVLAEQVPDEPLVQTWLAKEEVLAGKPSSAVQRMAPIIASISTYTPKDKVASYYWYGRALLDAGRPREAFEQLAMIGLLTRSVPSDIIPYLVEAAARSGNVGYARSLLERELQRSPESDVLWNDLGNVRSMAGDRRGAMDAYGRALVINPGNREAAANLMRAQQEEGARGR